MYERALFSVWLLTLVLFQSAESCELRPVLAQVPKRLPAGYVISEGTEALTLKGCAVKPVAFTSSDPDFAVNTDGTIITVRGLVITTKRFSVLVQDESGLDWRVDIILSCKDEKSSSVAHKRIKRRWRPLPFSLIENDSPPFPKDLEMIASDSSVNYTVYYQISGQGVTTDPVGLFLLDRTNGMLKVTRAVDREQYPQFNFIARVYDVRGKEVDAFLPITVNVEDKNDNTPEFIGGRFFSVQERCRAGTPIGQVNATDKDLANTTHTLIKFTLLNATDMFSIEPFTGKLTAKTNTLDREAQDKVYVNIEIRDMGGNPTGLFNTGIIVITLTDVNDNPPTFKEKLYKANVKENQENVLVTRIPVEDKDLVNTPNWKALFEVTKGNESGQFRMETDPKTNEGLLYVIKGLDFEKTPVVKLEITARNAVPLVGTDAAWLSVPLELSVGDEDEGPEFNPGILNLKVKENVPNGTVIGTYKALDPETKNSNGIKYYKVTDPGNWITVVESTGELKTAKTIDRESPLVHQDMYNITIRAVDESKKAGKGMVIILIEDENDNMPVIPSTDLVICSKGDALSSVLVEAVDLDKPPFSTPFIFEFGAEHDGKWKLKDRTDSSVVLEQAVPLPNGVYSVPLLVKDLQGVGKEQTMNVRVCSCEREENGVGICGARSASTSLGSLGILALVLSSLLLLLLCLLVLFICSTKRDKLYINDDTGTGGMLLKSNTEAPGEEVKEGALMIIPGTDAMDGSLQNGAMVSKNVNSAAGHIGQQFFQGGGVYNTTTQDFGTEKYYTSGRYDNNLYGNAGNFQKFSNTSALDSWNTNGHYLDRKLSYFGGEEEGRYADDLLKTYGNEGAGSPAGSVGCCSNLGEPEPLDFLNTLGPKFRPLADVCYTTNKSVK
ncbi:desmocollin 2-like protein isoform X2 [Rhinichthys klamathensis goyatoka]|uniref:desmocollin 2-like protein isoform X2 n=1 Tax=Rhinichthys klamathensis goyatoka TaxID=3034132 RepID=UPI0024B5A9F2|nr:desmocollin 2-like protein isoform X2 [Rhinichthys klamathensis goyatoka]